MLATDILDLSAQGEPAHNYYWTVWKLCQAISCLSVNERNRQLLLKADVVKRLTQVSNISCVAVSLRSVISGMRVLVIVVEGLDDCGRGSW